MLAKHNKSLIIYKPLCRNACWKCTREHLLTFSPPLISFYLSTGLSINRPLTIKYSHYWGRSYSVIWGGGGEYSYICVLPHEFLLKSVVITVDIKRQSSGRTRIYEYAFPPPPINALAAALLTTIVHSQLYTKT